MSVVDIVLVCADEAAYTHAQVIRKKGWKRLEERQSGAPSRYPCFDSFSESQLAHASRLAQLASNRQLALFVGAGVSIGSGLPSWFGLLHTIEDMFESERTLGSKTNWDPLAMADILEDWCESRHDLNGEQRSLKDRVCTYLKTHGRYPGLLLLLLISLPFHGMVTQNYDQLVERACECWNIATGHFSSDEEESLSKKRLSVIPYNPKAKSRHWLLKMHGCVSSSNEIVLTSKDYSNYTHSKSRAVAGLFQSQLMTSHLLFVGFSLSDPNYLRLLDETRDALVGRRD